MAQTTTSNITASVDAYYDKVLLQRAIPMFLHLQWAQVRPLPRNSGTGVIRFRRYTNLSAATTALSEGTNPTAVQAAVTDITATVAEYGNVIETSSKVEWMTVNGELTELTQLLGDNAGDSFDQIARDVLVAGTSVSYAGSATSRVTVATTDLIALNDIKKAVRTLKTNNAKKVTTWMQTDDSVDTHPIKPAFIAIVHPKTTYTLKTLTGWIDIANYPAGSVIMNGEVGTLDEARCVESTNAKIFTGAGSGGIDVYATLILAQNAYGRTSVTGEELHTVRQPLGSAGAADPLRRFGTVGWTGTFVVKILNDAYMTRIEHAVAA